MKRNGFRELGPRLANAAEQPDAHRRCILKGFRGLLRRRRHLSFRGLPGADLQKERPTPRTDALGQQGNTVPTVFLLYISDLL